VLRIDLVGPTVRLTRDGCAVGSRAIQRRQTRLALAALVLERAAPLSRDRLAGILWPASLPATWATALRGVLARVRSVLAEAGLPPNALVGATMGVQLRLPSDCLIDVETAEAALDRACAALAADDVAAAVADAETTLGVTRGGLLSDCEGDWVEAQRARVAGWHRRALSVAADAAERSGQHRVAAAFAEEALTFDPYAEWAYRTIMRTTAAVGERAAALDAYERCRQVLRDDFGVSPSPETQATHLALLGAPSDGLGDSRLPLVARREELGDLAAAWARAGRGTREAVIVLGGPGAGKSRLVSEFAASVEGAGHLVLRGRDDGHLSVPFRPFADALAGYVAARGSGSLQALGPVVDQLALLQHAPPAGDSAARDGGAADRWRLFGAVGSWLAAAGRDEPVLLVFEDIHWSSAATLALLRYVIDEELPARLLIVATCRIAEASDPVAAGELAGLLDGPNVGRLTPALLGVSDVVELLAAIGRSDPADLTDLAGDIVGATGGNPLYVSEIVRHLLRTHGPAAGRSRWSSWLGTATGDLSAGVAELVALRLRSLNPDSRDVIELAALAGDGVHVEVLVGAASKPEDVTTALGRAVVLGLISVVDGEVHFHHELLRAGVEATLGESRRSEAHHRLAVALDRRHLAAELPQRAYHWEAAAGIGRAEAEMAVRRHAEAGRQAYRLLAFERAAQHFETAMRLLEELDIGETRIEERCDLLIEMGTVRHETGDRRFADALGEACRLAYRSSDPVRLAKAALALAHRGATATVAVENHNLLAALEGALRDLPPDERELRTRVKAALAVESRWSAREELTAKGTMADEAVAEARRSGRPETLAAALVARHTLGQVQPVDALADAGTVRRIAARLADPAISCEAAVMAFDAWMGLGEPRRAEAEITTVEKVAERAHLTYFKWTALTRRAGWCGVMGEYELAEKLLDESVGLGAEIGIDPSLLHAGHSAVRFVALVEQDEAAQGVAALEMLAPFAGEDTSWLSAMAVALAESGNLDHAREYFDRVVPDRVATMTDDQMGVSALMNLARTAARIGDGRGSLLRPGLSIRSGQLSWMACFSSGPIDLGLAWVAAAEGDLESADRYLVAAGELCARAGTPVWADRVRRERAALLSRSAR
jgi:DNA-binding SARP family transcriptional activator